ncbi:MAG: hypothetical protein IPK79_00705 [Vampirovibrionales bacterium]|nr:hypothetical protein [Vampirovibrionales bacterium]
MSNEQARWPAGTPVDEATGAGGGRFAPSNGGGQSGDHSADSGAPVGGSQTARRLRVQRVVGQLVEVDSLFDVSFALRSAGIDPSVAIQPGDFAALLQEIERRTHYRPTSDDLLLWIAEDLGIEGDDFFTMLDAEGWRAVQAQIVDGDDLYTAIEELIGPPSRDALDNLAGIMPARLSRAQTEASNDTFWEPVHPTDEQMRQAYSHPRLNAQLDAGERVAMVVVTDRNGSILPDVDAEVYQRGEGEQNFNIDPEGFRTLLADSLPDGWRAAIRYEAYDHTAEYHTVEVAGVLYADDQRTYAGRFDLSFSDGDGDRIVNLNFLELEDRFQGHDAALSLMEGVVKHALDNDFARLEMLADITVGSYAWAKYGFDFAPSTDAPKRFVPDEFRAWAANKGPEYQPAAGWVGLDRIKTPYDIATYDPDPSVRIPGSMIFNPHVDRSALLHPGKAYMLDMKGFGEWDATASPALVYQLIQYKKAEALLRRDARKATPIIEMAAPAVRLVPAFDWQQRVQEDAGLVDLEDHFAISEEDIEQAAMGLTHAVGIVTGANSGKVTVAYDGMGSLVVDCKTGKDAMLYWMRNRALHQAPHNAGDPAAFHALDYLHVHWAETEDLSGLLRLARMARDAGYPRITFDVEGQIGRYAWAQWGVDFERQSEVTEYNARFDRWLKELRVDMPVRAFLHTPRAFAGFDAPGVRIPGMLIDNPYVRREASLPVGKAFMLDMRGMPAYLAASAPGMLYDALVVLAIKREVTKRADHQ